jgi:hypothetical protein
MRREFGAEKREGRLMGLKAPGFITLILMVLLCLAGMSGCGYELVRDKGIFGGEITTLSVPIFKNITYEPHISAYVTDSFSKELMSSGLFKMGREGTDGYLDGTIRSVRILPNAMNSNGVVVEKKIFIDIDLILYKQNGNLIRRWSFSDNEVYSSEIPNYEDYNKRVAVQRIADRVARRFCATILVTY